MLKRLAITLFVGANCMICVCGCTQHTRDAADESVVVITASGAATANERVTLNTGQVLQVRLPYQSGTGYSWRLASDPGMNPIIWFQGQDRARPQIGRHPGDTVFDVFTLRSVGPGDRTLKFVFDRPWETNVAPARVFNLRVTVKDARP
jgi:inhibitor of cysteine peptidase